MRAPASGRVAARYLNLFSFLRRSLSFRFHLRRASARLVPRPASSLRGYPFRHPHTERRKRAIHTLTSGTVAHGATSHVSPTDPYPRVPNPAHDERAGPTAPPRTSSLSCTICPLARHSLACVAFGFNPGAWRPTRALGRPSRRFQSSPRGHYSAPCSAWP